MTGYDRSRRQDIAGLAREVARLSALLTKERGILGSPYLEDQGLRRAYLLYFVPCNIPKMQLPLKELYLHPMGLLPKEKLRVIDLGSGPGSALLGVMNFFSGLEHAPCIEFTAVDQVSENLSDAKALFSSAKKESGLDASLRIVRASILEAPERFNKEKFDVVILSNVLNELFYGSNDKIEMRRNFIEAVMENILAQAGSLIIIEPALRETSREMLEVGCGLMERGMNIYAPCPPEGLCATLARPRDWHHEDIPWEPPDMIKEIDRIIGLRKDSLKFSYLILRKDGLSVTDIYDCKVYRVVSEPLITKGKIEFYLCAREGRILVVRMDRDRSDLNKAFGSLRRGDFVYIENPIDEGRRLKVGKGTSVVVKTI